MSFEVDKSLLNCKVDFSTINENNVQMFLSEFEKTFPVVFVHDLYGNFCYNVYGKGFYQYVSCEKSHFPDDITNAVVGKYVQEKGLNEHQYAEDLAKIKLQEELCNYYPEQGPEHFLPGVVDIIILIGATVGVLALFGCCQNH